MNKRGFENKILLAEHYGRCYTCEHCQETNYFHDFVKYPNFVFPQSPGPSLGYGLSMSKILGIFQSHVLIKRVLIQKECIFECSTALQRTHRQRDGEMKISRRRWEVRMWISEKPLSKGSDELYKQRSLCLTAGSRLTKWQAVERFSINLEI